MDPPEAVLAEFEKTGRIEWASDLVEVPTKAGFSNVYAEMGTSFASAAIANPNFAAALLGTWINGMGADHVVGDGFGVPWVATVADRGPEAHGDSGGNAEKTWLRTFGASEWHSEKSNLRIQLGSFIQPKFAH
ncbi:hypothetical protein C2W62_09035 [Candidatus Entotheonella serta]|nr:hypothetical protein C2W62_09035 [Candidatus Entotheonella serta]